MGWLSGLFETKAAAPSPANVIARATGSSPAMSYGGAGVGIGPVGGWDIDKAVHDGVERVIWVFRACDVIAQNQAGLPIVLRKGFNRRGGEVIDDTRLWKLLNFRANSYERSWQFRYRLSMILLLARRGAFVEIVRGRDGRPSELHLLPPGVTEPIPDPKKFVSGYLVRRSDWQVDELPPENVIWLRLKPHPTDPYAQLTPLMAAGIHAETDWLANMFNRNFLANDGRPGLLVTIQGRLNAEDAAEIKRRFSGGPMRAGETSVIESDGVSVADMSANPRDVQWDQLLTASKERLLMAFGVPESIMGNASGRTFDNADAERENFWMDTEINHCDNIAASLDVLTGDIDDDVVLAFDYEGVDVLQRTARIRREEQRAEVAQGLRTLDEYFKDNGREPWDVPGTRILLLPTGVAIAKNDSDLEAIKKLPVLGQPPQPGDPSAAARQGALAGVAAGQRQLGNLVAARALTLVKQMPAIESKDAKGEDIIDAEVIEEEKTHPYLGMRTRVEGEIEGILTAWDSQKEDVVAARLYSSHFRKGTRHWEGSPGTKALDPSYVADVDRFADDLTNAMQKTLRRIITREAGVAARDLDGMGILDQMGRSPGGTPLNRAFNGTANKDATLGVAYDSAMGIVRGAAKRQTARVLKRITELDAQGKSMKQIEAEIRKMMGTRSQWRKSLAVNVVTSAVEGARAAVYTEAKQYMTKTWNTEGDERVRHSHKRVDGKSRRGGTPFRVGKGMLQFPCDPTGPIEEIANCRCWLEWAPSSRAN